MNTRGRRFKHTPAVRWLLGDLKGVTLKCSCYSGLQPYSPISPLCHKVRTGSPLTLGFTTS